jgi:hypothetical protein
MKLGANEPKKVVVLAVLGVLSAYLAYTNLFSGPSASTPRTAPLPSAAEGPAAPGAPAESGPPLPPRAIAGRGRSDDFHPVLHSKRPEDRVDTSKIDPTLRLDLLAKLEEVASPNGGRNPFKMGPPPPPKPDPLKGPEPIVKLTKPVVPPVGAKAAPTGPQGPAPLQTGLKYYGYTSPSGASARTAFFLDGEDILVAKEGDTLKRLYRVVRVGSTSAIVEETNSKRRQTIPLTEEAG